MSRTPIGRRERKKAQTRRAIADAALRLFLERGFHEVTVAEIADAADVAVSTLFKHFPSKESLVFEDEAAIEDALVRAITDRPAGTTVLHAIRDALLNPPDGDTPGPSPALVELVSRTPALRAYLEQMWSRHAEALAAALAADTGIDGASAELRALARYIVAIPSIARHDPDPARAITAIFDRLEHGWGAMLGDDDHQAPPPATP